MTLEKNTVINGFTVTAVKEITDCHGTLYEMVHNQTGAQLCWLKRDDFNKTFTITFKTIPENDTGVFHIIEHTVLNGSEKYPVREPFVELLKSSMQTFLNAFTFPDKTMYPVSSRNEKDFMNLMSVYLDAVFHPLLYTNKNIFMQEGWHYEIRRPEDEPVFKGVVLNEMKGAFSSVDETIINEFSRMLFPDNCYRFVSGGDPEHIPDLTYEKYLETHRHFYHPSNARVFLDGDLNIEEVTRFIHEEYFSKYEKENMNFDIPMQKEVKAEVHRYAYEIAEGEDTSDKTQIAFAKVISAFDEIEKNIAWSVLSSVLTANNEAVLKKAIIGNGLGQDLELDICDGIQQPWIVMNIRNTNEANFEKIKEVIRAGAEELIKNGLDHEEIKATLNQMEFRYREKHEPAGVMYAQRAMESWLYGGDPAAPLCIGGIFETLRQKADQGYFEELMKEFFLNPEHVSALIAIPDANLSKERIRKETERLHQAKESWGKDIEQYIAENNALDRWQASQDSPEVLAKLPKLSLSDVNDAPEDFPWTPDDKNGVPMLVYPEEDTGIVYMNFYFNIAGITQDHLPSAGFFSSLLLNLRTRNKTLAELQAAVKKYVGSMGFFMDAYSVNHDGTSCIPVIGLSISVLKQNVSMALELAKEVMYETVFDKDKIYELLKQDNEGFRQAMIMNGHSVAMRRVSAHNSAEGLFREMVGGYESGKYEKDLEENWDEKADEFIHECEMYAEILFAKARCTASFTGNSNRSEIVSFVNSLSTIDATPAKVHYSLLKEPKECITIPAGIAYSALGSTLRNSGNVFDARMNVMSHILTYDWLWNEIRVKGGAYGTGFSVNMNGNYAGYTYRDPSPLTAIKAIQDSASFIEKFDEDGLDQYIIGTIAAGEPLLVPSQKVRIADSRYFTGLSYKERCENRKKILQLTKEELNSLGREFAAGLANPVSVIVASGDVNEEAVKLGYKALDQI